MRTEDVHAGEFWRLRCNIEGSYINYSSMAKKGVSDPLKYFARR